MPISDVDTASAQPFASVQLPWAVGPASSWLDYNCWVEVELDPGMVLHKTLPQVYSSPDTLASAFLADYAFTQPPDKAPPATGGVNLSPNVQVQDVIQRMTTPTYRFVVAGSGLRAGYQIPIPGLVSVGGIDAVPVFPQRGYNKLVGNLCGVPLWAAVWELHYIIVGLKPKTANAPVPPNLAARINAATPLPTVGVSVALAPLDNNAVQAKPIGFITFRGAQ